MVKKKYMGGGRKAQSVSEMLQILYFICLIKVYAEK